MKTIILDAGHGGHDSGAVGNGIKEKDITLQIVKYLKAYLDGNYKDIKVLLTRSTDVFVELNDRAKFANTNKSDFFMSVHINASATEAGNGFETFIYNKTRSATTKAYQKKIHAKIVKEAPFFNDRGLQSANFAVLRQTISPAILTESGFITNKKDSDVLKDQNKLKALAIAHALGIAEALNLSLKPVKPTTNTVYKVGKPFDSKAEAEALLNSLIHDGHKGFTIYQEKN